PNGSPEIRRGSYFESGTDQLRSLTHELQAEVTAPAQGRIFGVEAPTIVADFHGPAPRVARHADADRAGLGMLAGVLERLLDHPQDHDLDRLREGIDARLEVDADGHVERRLDLGRRLGDGAAQAEVGEQRRPELAQVRADALQLPREDVTQLAQLLPRQLFVAVQQPLDDLDLEDGVGQRLRGPVVDLAGETAPLRLLRLDDAHLGIGRRRRAARV